jgi:catalase
MSQPGSLVARSRSYLLIAVIIGAAALAFAYTAGWFSPRRVTPDKMVDAFKSPAGVPLGHRRNHAKGICFTGVFESNGAGSALSRAQVFTRGQYRALGRLNLGTPDPDAADASVRVRGMGLRIVTPDGWEWRSAMIDLPFFPVATPQAFYELLLASANKDPDAMKAFASAHPEFATFGAWAGSAPWTGSYAEERYNSINSFVFTDGAGGKKTVRWSLIPAAQPVAIPHDELEKRDPNFLEHDIVARVHSAPQRWTMILTAANPADPTNDPSKAWPEDRRAVEVGTLIVQQIEPERDGPCREINFDPTVLPPGISTSDDPFPAARSAAYMKSYDRRTAEAEHYPRTATVATP